MKKCFRCFPRSKITLGLTLYLIIDVKKGVVKSCAAAHTKEKNVTHVANRKSLSPANTYIVFSQETH